MMVVKYQSCVFNTDYECRILKKGVVRERLLREPEGRLTVFLEARLWCLVSAKREF